MTGTEWAVTAAVLAAAVASGAVVERHSLAGFAADTTRPVDTTGAPGPAIAAVRAVLVASMAVCLAAAWHAGVGAFVGVAVQLPLWCALAGIDLRTFRLPHQLTAALWVLAPAAVVAIGVAEDHWPWQSMALGLAVWGGTIGGLYALTRGRGMGWADVRLAPSLGLVAGWFGWHEVVVGWLAAFVVGTVVGGALLVAGGTRERGRRRHVPFGPFLIVGAALGIGVGDTVVHAWLSWFGLA